MKGLVLRLENTGVIGKHPLCLRYPTLALGQDLSQVAGIRDRRERSPNCTIVVQCDVCILEVATLGRVGATEAGGFSQGFNIHSAARSRRFYISGEGMDEGTHSSGGLRWVWVPLPLFCSLYRNFEWTRRAVLIQIRQAWQRR